MEQVLEEKVMKLRQEHEALEKEQRETTQFNAQEDVPQQYVQYDSPGAIELGGLEVSPEKHHQHEFY